MGPTNTPSGESRDEAQKRLRFDRQIARLNDRKASRKYQDGLFDSIKRHRRDKRKSPIDKLDLAPQADGVADFVVAVPGEVLVSGELGAKAKQDLKDAGFTKASTLSPSTSATQTPPTIGKLRERVVRYTNSGADLKKAAEMAKKVQGPNVQASVNYVLPLGYVAKGEGGFEPADVNPEPGPGLNQGTGPRVAVIDTGIAKAARTDGWLDNITRNPDGSNEDVLYQGPPEPPDLLDLAAGHGTFVTGIIQQVAPSAEIKMYRAIGPDGIGNDVQVAEAILQAASEGAQIINLSLGTPSLGADDAPVATRAALEIILGQPDAQVVVVASAGNSPDTQPYYPAAFPGVVAVASCQADANLTPSEWSSRGPDVAFSVVGEGVRSTYVVGQESPEVDKPAPPGAPELDGPDTFSAPSWAIGTGTSFAAPQIVGRIADRMAHTGLSALEACNQLRQEQLPNTPPAADFGVRLRILPGTPR